ncbi:alpha/beta hydrolase [Leptospira interrogans]|nr:MULTISPECIES: alpha/beta hydrolase [Leptospira]EMM79533.1 alpha/beta hydrolase family protein [Leptospira interrogans str. 2006001854]EMN70993.1 alpha/beta hydrolase family protein [Leptospira interrogans serovar Bataviae str. UI 08561]EMO05802.1 alpha/beta hydrolase family protein [Leptospira interrogans serovar Icterohaemorrhagiae str. Verdun HP]ARB96970.1 alpha/beta hydrolase [Leptospira interrogans serovar Copenhageni]EKO26705.1 alpha/beta hydrolase family protein [Leptospira interrogan
MLRKTFNFQGLNLSYIDTNSKSKPTILLCHANGYSAFTYKFYIESLQNSHRVIALDFAGHGESDSTLNFRDWYFFRDQVLSLIENENLNNVIGIGHSLGGASLLLASYHSPDKFKKVIAHDPVTLNFLQITYSRIFHNPLAQVAIKRRREFKNLDTVRKIYKRTPSFSRWDNGIYDDYIQSCFRLGVNGEAILRCAPEVEAKIFDSVSYRSLFQFGKIKTETHITIPDPHEVCSPNTAKKIISGNIRSSLEIWPKTSHFFPFEEKHKTLDRILRVLD